MMRNLLIVVIGLSGSGKSTAAEYLIKGCGEDLVIDGVRKADEAQTILDFVKLAKNTDLIVLSVFSKEEEFDRKVDSEFGAVAGMFEFSQAHVFHVFNDDYSFNFYKQIDEALSQFALISEEDLHKHALISEEKKDVDQEVESVFDKTTTEDFDDFETVEDLLFSEEDKFSYSTWDVVEVAIKEKHKFFHNPWERLMEEEEENTQT